MSLSDWDVLSLDESGRPANGVSEPSPAGLTVELVEDRLHVLAPLLWMAEALPNPPTIAILPHGELTLFDIRVVAQRCERSGLVWATWFHRGAELIGTIGICLSGFDESKRYTGITATEVRRFGEVLNQWGASQRVPRALTTLGLGNVLRFNQGDAFFARSMQHALDATPPGKAELPLLYQSNRGEALGRIQVHAPGSPEALAQEASNATLPA